MSRPNIFGGVDESTPEGVVRSRPNIRGGMDYELSDGRRLYSRPNIFGGRNIESGDGRVLSCRPTSSAVRTASEGNDALARRLTGRRGPHYALWREPWELAPSVPWRARLRWLCTAIPQCPRGSA